MLNPDLLFTPSGVRLRRRVHRPGNLNWLLLPGGPGIGSESLHELADLLGVPGDIWLVDLPGDGSNVSPPGAAVDPFHGWPQVLLEAPQLLPNSIYVGHSTGGMYLLSTPELEQHVIGLALVSTAPDAGWRPHFFAMTQRNPLPEVVAATARYEADRTNDRIADIAVASAEWNFTPAKVHQGRELLSRMPYNSAAVDWSDRNFDDVYAATWWPKSLPVLILGGAEDRIVVQHLWDRPAWQGPNVIRQLVPDAAHFLWLEQPQAVQAAFAELTAQIIGGREHDSMLRGVTGNQTL